MAANARELAKQAAAAPELATFLDIYGKADLDTRAGDEFEEAWTDEDHTAGKLDNAYGICLYEEGDCSPLTGNLGKYAGVIRCTFDHFHSKLAIPFVQKDATGHARQYLDWAVKLHKAGKCNPNPDTPGSVYFIFAARALGHAIHLVDNIGLPQHVEPGMHHAIFGHDRRLHDTWILASWNETVRYVEPFTMGAPGLA